MEYCRILKFCVVIFLNFRRLYCLVKWLLLSHCSHLDLPIMSTFFVLYSLLHVRPSIWDFFLFAWSTSFRICLQNESGFPGGSDCKASACGSICLQCRTPGFDPWFGKIPWRRKWQPTPVLLPGKFHGPRSLVGCSPWGRQESDTTERLPFHFSLSGLEKEMATRSSILTRRIPGTEEPVGCRLSGRTESDTTDAT